MRAWWLFSAFLVAGCSGGSSPIAPTPTPVPAPTTAVVSGRVTATNGGQPLSGVAVGLGAATVTSDGAGAFTSTLPLGSLRVTLTAAGILPRSITAAVNGARDLPLDAIALSGGFDQTFYRQFVRNIFDAPGTMEPLRRWTQNPQLYLRTVDDAGAAIDARTLDQTEATIRSTAPAWTNGQFVIASVERGPGTKQGAAGWLTVQWMASTSSGRCGQANVGLSGGTVDLFYKSTNCQCDGSIRPRTVRHELGHAFGFWHTDQAGDLMFASSSVCDAQPSARERYHAAIAYSRPVGNVDPDNDPTSTVLSLPHKTVQ